MWNCGVKSIQERGEQRQEMPVLPLPPPPESGQTQAPRAGPPHPEELPGGLEEDGWCSGPVVRPAQRTQLPGAGPGRGVISGVTAILQTFN